MRIRDRRRLAIGVTLVVVLAAAVAATTLVYHGITQSSCQRYADEFAAAMGDGISPPDSAAMAALKPADANQVRQDRAAYHQAFTVGSPTARQRRLVEDSWKSFVGQQKAAAQARGGC